MATARIPQPNIGVGDTVSTVRHRLTEDMQNAVAQAEDTAQSLLNTDIALGIRPRDFIGSLQRLARVLAVNPRVVAKKQMQLAGELTRIMLGRSHIKPPPHDLRFRHPIWQDNGYYRRVMQAYLVWRKSLFDILASAEADEIDKERAKFILLQITAAAAPTNNPLGNPGFVDSLVKTRGKSLVKGARNFVYDMRHNHGMPRQVNKDDFRVGKDLATSEGSVVFRNSVCEVIQYKPTTGKVYPRPALIVPPQINKYYIIDLTPEKSFVQYAVGKGLQVFTISWRNPTKEHRHWNFDTYVEAVIEAIEVVRDITGQDAVDLIAACAGGATALATAGYLQARGEQDKIGRLTLLVTVIDTSQPMLLSLFASRPTLEAGRRYVKRRGVVEGSEMARAFAWLRPSDLVWMFFANNYIMGNDPPRFDFLYWNNDSTRLPAGFHADCMDLFEDNPFLGRRSFKVLGQTIDPRAIDRDSFVVSGIKDHIVPWRSSYAATQILGGKTRFVLGSSGHIQAVVSPPDKKNARYYVNEDYPPDPDEWLHNAGMREGSWWNEWLEWITAGQQKSKTARKRLGNRAYPPGDPAPGRYVFT